MDVKSSKRTYKILPSTVTLHNPGTIPISRLTIHIPGDLVSNDCDQAGVEIALSSRVYCVPLHLISVSSPIRLDSYVRVNSGRQNHRCLFFIFVYAPIDFSKREAKKEFYRDISRLLRNGHTTNVKVHAG